VQGKEKINIMMSLVRIRTESKRPYIGTGIMCFKKKVLLAMSIFLFAIAGEGISKTELYNSFEAFIGMIEGEWTAAGGDYSFATDRFLCILDMARKWRNLYLEAYCLMRIGDMYWNRGQLLTSTKYYEDSLKITVENKIIDLAEKNKSYLRIHSLYRKGRDLRDHNRYIDSSDSFRKALENAQALRNAHYSEKLLRQIIVNNLFLNELAEVEKLNILLNGIHKYTNNKREECNFFINLGIYYSKKSNLSASLNSFYRAHQIAEKENYVDLKAQALTNLGTTFIDFGDHSSAQKMFEDALLLDIELRNDADIGIDLNNLGIICLKSEDFDQASIYFMEALLFAWRRNDERVECYLLNNMGYNFFKKKKFNESLRIYNSALIIARKNSFKELEISILCNIGNALFDLGRYQDAISAYFKGQNKSLESKIDKFNWELALGIGKCYKAKGDYEESIICFNTAEKCVLSNLNKISEDPYRVGFMRNKSSLFSEKIEIFLRDIHGNNQEIVNKDIFAAIELAKSISLLDSLSFSKTKINERTLRIKQNGLFDITKRISSIISESYAPIVSLVEKERLNLSLIKAKGQYINSLSINKPKEKDNNYKYIFREIATIENIQQEVLDRETGLLEYFLYDKASILFYLTHKKAEIYLLPGKKYIEDSIRLLINFYKDPKREAKKTNAARRRIFKEICIPLDNLGSNKEIRKIIIVPDGLLNYLPFEILNDEQENANSFLIDRYQVSYAPSSSVLLFLRREADIAKKMRGFLGVGTPRGIIGNIGLPRKLIENNRNKKGKLINNIELDNPPPLVLTKKEIMRIAKLFDKEDRYVYLDTEANEELIKNISKKEYQVVHFACHGIIDDDTPIRSALLLSKQSEIEDGYFQIREIYDLSIRANLVVLSACRSASGIIGNYEGIMGLPRVFFYSGAQSVLSTLWKIEDKPTSLLMKKFYYFLSKGVSKAQALRLAKQEMRLTRYRNPYYWAGFILSGDCESAICFH